jgi:hypothetical protein
VLDLVPAKDRTEPVERLELRSAIALLEASRSRRGTSTTARLRRGAEQAVSRSSVPL